MNLIQSRTLDGLIGEVIQRTNREPEILYVKELAEIIEVGMKIIIPKKATP